MSGNRQAGLSPPAPFSQEVIDLDAEKLTTALYEKMKAEQDSYRAWLVAQPPEKILDHAYEDVCCKGEFQKP